MKTIKKNLEHFVINNSNLELLESRLNEFNIFEILGVHLFEIRHSNALGFLFSSSASHGLGDYFLKKFLMHTLAESELSSISPITVDCWDLTDAVIKREYRDIDLLIVSRSNQFVCCIENKVLASESNDQLEKYKSIIETEFSDFKNRLYIFLSPMGIEPSDPDTWIVSNYEIVANILKSVIELKLKDVGSQQSVFIMHYHNTVRRYLLETSDEVALAKEIYNKHKVALDFIFKNISGNRQEIFDAIKKIVAESNGELIPLFSTLSRIRFTTKSLDKLPKIGDGRWVKINHVFAFEILNNSDSISLTMIMGPADQEYRARVLDALKPEFLPKFLKYKAPLNEMYNMIYKRVIVPKEEYASSDLAEKINRIRICLDKATNSDISEIESFFDLNISGIK